MRDRVYTLRIKRRWLRLVVPVLVTVPVLAPASGAVGDANEIGDLPASAGSGAVSAA